MRKKNSRFLSIRINKDLLDTAKVVADKLGISLSQMMRRGLKVVIDPFSAERKVRVLSAEIAELQAEVVKLTQDVEDGLRIKQALQTCHDKNVELEKRLEKWESAYKKSADTISSLRKKLERKSMILLQSEERLAEVSSELSSWKQHPFRMWHKHRLRKGAV